MKHSAKILSFVMVLLMALGVFTVFTMMPQEAYAASNTYKKIKSTAELTSGGTYLIVYEDEKFIFNGSLTSLDASNNYKSVAISNAQITGDYNANAFTITKSGSDYTIKSASGKYIGRTSNSNELDESTSTKYTNKITFNSNGTVNIIGSGGAYLRFNTTSGQDRFRYYKSSSYTGQKAICLYKLEEGCSHSYSQATCEAPKICSKCGATDGSALGHSWQEATCVAPKTCSTCGKQEGELGNHTWQEATCTSPKTCSVCKTTEGDVGVHPWQEANCTSPKTCSACGATEGDALGHDWEEATCTSPKTCSVCNQIEGSALGHDYINGNCNRCGESKPKTVSVNIKDYAGSHGWADATKYTSVTINELITATAKGGGNTGKFYTNGNNWRFYETESASLVIDAVDGIIITSIKITFEAANSGGLKYNGSFITSGAIVAVNGNTITLVVDNTGTEAKGQARISSIEVTYICTHKWNDASCSAPKTCALCGATTGEALEHKYNDVVVTDPDCENGGYTTYTCDCGHSYIDNRVDALGHTPGKEVVENKVAAECEKDGSYDNVVYCSVCEAEISRNSETIPAIGHSYDDGVVTAPTFDAQGFTTYTCENCDDSYVDENSYVAALIAVASVDGVRFESLQKAVDNANGGTVLVLADIELDASIKIDGLTVTIDLDGYTITASYTAGNTALVDDMVEVILAKNGANVTITGNGSMVANGEGEHVEVISAIDGAIVTIENGSFVSAGCTAIYATRGAVVTIKGGFFEAKETFGGKYYTLDVNEAEENLGQIIVLGGTFAHFNPANHTNDGAANGNKLAKGFHAIKNDSDAYVVNAHSYENGVCACGFVVKFNSASITLQDNLLVNFKLDMASLDRAGIQVLQVIINGQVYAAEDKAVFSVAIAPHQMTDVIVAYFIFSDHNGEQESAHIQYSAATYCENKLGDASLHDLVVSLLNYGAAAQVAVGYNLDNLANACLSDTEKLVADVKADAASEQSESKEEYSALWTAAGLLLNDKIVIRFAFEAEDVKDLTVRVEINGRTYTVEEFADAGENRYYVYIEGLNATQLRNKVSVTVMNGENAVSTTLTYSVEVYAAKVFGYAEVEGYENLVSLVKAMMVYGDAAKAYIGK